MIGSRSSPTASLGKVAIVGASTSGLHAATLLAESGFEVCVYEASEEFNPRPRTLIVTSHLTDVLGYEPSEAIVNRVQHFDLFSPNASSRITLRKPDLIVERQRLMHLLADRARQAGAQIVLGHRFVGFADGRGRGNETVSLHFTDGAGGRDRVENANFVLGADGVHSRVSGDVTGTGSRSVALLQALVPLKPGADPLSVQVWFDRNDTRFFYWLIPESSERAAVGLIADDAASARARLDDFLHTHDLEPIEYQSSAVGAHQFSSRYWASVDGTRVRLVGDAAGQVKMTTVGGLVTGLRGACAAAEAIMSSARGGRESRNLKQELDLHLVLRLLLDRFSNDDYDVLLKLLNSDLKQLLETRNRDELNRSIWRLPFVQPRLISLATRALLRRRGASVSP